MSGTAGDLTLKVGVDGLPQLEASFNRIEERLNTTAAVQRQFEQSSLLVQRAQEAGVVSSERAAQAMAALQSRFEAHNRGVETASGSMGRFNQIIQQGGYQAGDLAVQIQGGTNALVALSQQGSQFLGMFGPAGAVAGVILTVGTIAANFLLTANNAEQAKSKGQEALDAMAKSGADTIRVLREINELFLTAGQRSAALANAQIRARREEATASLETITAGSMELRRQLAEEQNYLRELGGGVGRVNSGQGRGIDLYRAEDNNARLREMQAIERINKLRGEIAKADSDAERLRQSLERLENAGRYGAEEFGPTSADPFGTNALRASLDRRFAAQQQYGERINQINQQVREGGISAAEGERLATLAVKERDEAVQKLGETVKTVARNLVEVQDANGGFFSRDAGVQKRLDEWRASAEREQKKADDKAAAARDKADREYTTALEKQQQQSARVTDDIVSYTADSFADMFSQTEMSWDRMWQNMRRTAVSLAARIAAEAVIRPIVTPIVGGMYGAIGGSAGPILASVSTPGLAGSGVDTMQIAGGLGGLSSAVGGGGLLTGAANWINGSAASFAPSLFASPAVGMFGSNAAALGGGMNSGAAMAGNAAAPSSMFGTMTGTVAGIGGIAAGGYGIYSGLERGGLGGYTQAAGGAAGVVGGLGMLASAGGAVGGGLMAAAPWLATAGPYGLAAAAVLAIVSAFLPGQKPSNREGNATMDLLTGGLSIDGQTGGKFSAENRQAAQGIATSISDIAASLRAASGVSATPYSFSVGVGDRDGIYLRSNGQKREFDRNETGSQALIQAAVSDILASMRGAMSDTVRRTVDYSGGDLQTTLANLQWHNEVYVPLQQTVGVVDQFAAAVASTRVPFEQAIDKANSLRLPIEGLAQSMTAAVEKLYEARNKADFLTQRGWDVRLLRARGQDQDAALMELDLQQSAEREQYVINMQSQGFDWNTINERYWYLQQVQWAERLKIIEDFGNQAVDAERMTAQQRAQAWESAMGNAASVVSSLTDYSRSLNYGGDSPLSLTDQFRLAERQFNAVSGAAVAGDAASLRQLQSYSQDYLSSARGLYGSTSGFAQAFDRVQNVLGSVGTLSPDTLTASFYNEAMQTQTDVLANRLDAVVAAVDALRRETQMRTYMPQIAA